MHPNKTFEYVLPKVGTYKDLHMREVPLAKPRASEVLVKVHAVSLQYRDLAISTGAYDMGKHENIVPCSDMAGEVIAVGEDVTEWKTGDRVCANFSTGHLHGDVTEAITATSMGGQSPGVLTQYRTFPASALVHIPGELTYVQASTLPCAALTAYNALHGPNPVKAGDTVLVLGTGGVSIFALQFAVASGATVIATSSSDEKMRVAAKLGAKYFINYKTTPDWDKEVMKITGGRGVDHVIEVGGQGTFPKSIRSARYGGHVHVIGFLDSDKAQESIVLPLISRAIIVRGICIGSVAQFKDMIRLIEANPTETVPVVDKVFAFDEVISAYAYLESQKHVGKIVIQVAKD